MHIRYLGYTLCLLQCLIIVACCVQMIKYTVYNIFALHNFIGKQALKWLIDSRFIINISQQFQLKIKESLKKRLIRLLEIKLQYKKHISINH